MKRNKTYVDRRVFLRIKLRSLAEEARIIRSIEHKHRDISQLNQMHQHRTMLLRMESRHTHLAYGLIRGLRWSDMEHNWASQDKQRQPDWKYIQRLLTKYGNPNPDSELRKTESGDYLMFPKDIEQKIPVAA